MHRLLGILLALGAAPVLFAQTPELEAAREAIRAADLDLARAVADRRLDRFLELVAEEALFFGREVSQGREAVGKAWSPFFTDASRSLKWTPTQVEVSRSGDLGYSVGSYERAGPDASGKPAVAVGNYVTIWRKQADGRWSAVLDAGTPGTPKEKSP